MECPSWLLEEICTNFSNLTVLKFKELCNRASHLVLCGHDKPILSDTSEGINSVNNHTNLVLIGNWLLLKPAGYDCPSTDLEKEVVQLGLPPEHGIQLRKVYENYKSELREKVCSSVYREPHATIIDASPSSITFQADTQMYDVSMSGSMMNQLKNDVENALSKMKDFAETLPMTN
ncbi:Vacuolar protein sorting-associated protein 13D [Caenorhabditis elegans]|nr:Vacuolar protein sorting-associated protein 13D [Caenorhabditis elegans]CCD68361.1 Vacuolar protein sorting-associated protein 13D [Caenorhabditis elegans]|eukprot:NP_491191.2 Uncharacterized protein CELE_T28F2.2 [Caenorhabditis elegans]